MNTRLMPALFLLVVSGNTAMAQGQADTLKDLPDLQTEKFRVDPYLRTVAKLQALGKDKATHVLLQFAKSHDHDNQVIVLCRMLFKQKKDTEFRRPLIGAAHFLGGTNYKNWPLEPIELVDNIPFLITGGYSLKGLAEPAQWYVKYCSENCDWNDATFRPKTEKEKQRALDKLFASPKWKNELDDGEKIFLSSQIK
jgi:hypothetical protein